MIQLLKYISIDILKNKFIIAYCIILSALGWSVFNLEGGVTKGVLSLLNVVLLITPLVAILFTTIYLYNSSEFIELLVSQPIRRGKVWRALFVGISLNLVGSYVIGVGIPLLIYADFQVACMMILSGVLLSLVFVSIAFLCSLASVDKVKGIGLSMMLWLYFSLLFDGLVLFLFFQFSDYPIEKLVIVMSALSPIDLCRILILIQLDISAMMGLTGRLFHDIFGTNFGFIVSFLLLLIWLAIPFLISLYKFKRKDL